MKWFFLEKETQQFQKIYNLSILKIDQNFHAILKDLMHLEAKFMILWPSAKVGNALSPRQNARTISSMRV